MKTPARAPRANAHCERAICSLHREVPDHSLIIGKTHARRVLTEYQEHYNKHRPTGPATRYHPKPRNNPPPVQDSPACHVLRTHVRGVTNEYRYTA
ncbi:integrase core domain-containing protein [Saccharopolyspora sp. ASAGF58]|uniref:integrase core domain-containing protein n=1 Tax=Saccharopolyspora sp. ASAGF58 TaxID=2719023 RepID=UPI00352FEF1F